MKLKVNIVIAFITAAILASCTSSTMGTLNKSVPSANALKSESVKEYFNYQNFSSSSIQKLEEYMGNLNLQKNEKAILKELITNLKTIASKKKFTVNVSNSNIYSYELMELVYDLDLPITIQWNNSNKGQLKKDSILEISSGFCSTIYEDALESISDYIEKSNSSTLIIYMADYAGLQKSLTAKFPKIKSTLFSKGYVQNFTSKILGINDSDDRFKKITSLNPNQELKFAPRARRDIENIILLLEPDQYKSVLPALKYHGGKKFRYINFISSLENLDSINQLLDFENSFVPFPQQLSLKVSNKEIISLEKIMQLSMLNDWLLIEIIKQSGIRSADILGMTGSLEYQKNSCTKRDIAIQRVTSTWISS